MVRRRKGECVQGSHTSIIASAAAVSASATAFFRRGARFLGMVSSAAVSFSTVADTAITAASAASPMDAFALFALRTALFLGAAVGASIVPEKWQCQYQETPVRLQGSWFYKSSFDGAHDLFLRPCSQF